MSLPSSILNDPLITNYEFTKKINPKDFNVKMMKSKGLGKPYKQPFLWFGQTPTKYL